ncbi:MAG: hypothetical protein KME60_03385 [Cyanomargarita calcarea GSE-NOS-MK-12-04C]|jgi:hypothetical protein|uniref:Uncharacterized protein n=1 Tax=Cyanomargarita calcarea GSE-NOS-MK-12-04C TaxID=2839659 RepID=A0A951QHG1_9CYAN|nr:hypothetical protein [Cyanomargarita calcarea GSE-NOS-MK-12-04C]
MLNVPKPKITYSLLSGDEICLENVKDFSGDRTTVVLRQATPADLDTFELLQKDLTAGKITARDMDDRSLAKLIIKWGDRSDTPTSLELRSLPLETRGVLLEIFKSFCMPSFELLEASDEGGKA